MKKIIKVNLKSFIMGMTVMFLLSATVIPTFAAFITKTITVETGVKVYNDDQQLNLTDANGNAVEPFIYNGTTYLPVRAIANTFGKAISYDGKTQGVYIGKHDSDTPAMMLSQLKPYNEHGEGASFWGYKTLKDNIGNLHSDALSVQVAGGGPGHYVNKSYIIDGKYRKTKGVFFISEAESSTGGNAVLKIYGDEKLLYTSPELKAGKNPIAFDVDITGTMSIKYEIDQLNDVIFGFSIADVGLYQ